MAENGSTRIHAAHVQNQDEQQGHTEDSAPAKCRECGAAFFVNHHHKARWTRVTTMYTCKKCQNKDNILAEIESRTKIELSQQAHERALATAESGIKLKLAEAQTEAKIAQIQADMKVKLAVERTRQYEIEQDIQEKESERQRLALKEFTALQEAGENVTVHDLIKLLQTVNIKSKVNIPSTNLGCAKFTGDLRTSSKHTKTTKWMCASAQY